MHTHHHKGAQGALQQQPNIHFKKLPLRSISYIILYYFIFKCMLLHVYRGLHVQKLVPSNTFNKISFHHQGQMHFKFSLPLQ